MSTAEVPNQTEQAISEFIRKWQGSGSGERSNFQSFLNELCDLLEVPRPDPARADDRDNAYVFERAVQFDDGDGNITTKFIDLYKRGCFVMEAKQGSTSDDRAPRNCAGPRKISSDESFLVRPWCGVSFIICDPQ